MVATVTWGNVRGSTPEGHILAGKVACQAGREGYRNHTLLNPLPVAKISLQLGLKQLLPMPFPRILMPNELVGDGNTKVAVVRFVMDCSSDAYYTVMTPVVSSN